MKTVIIFVFQDKISLCNSPFCSETHFVSHAVLKLKEILLPLPAEIKGSKWCAYSLGRHLLLFYLCGLSSET